MRCFPAFFHSKPKSATLRRNNFLPPKIASITERQTESGEEERRTATEGQRETHTQNGDQRGARGKKKSRGVIEFVSIFSGHVTIGTTFPRCTSFSTHTLTHTFFVFSAESKVSRPPPTNPGSVKLQKNVDHSPRVVEEETGAPGSSCNCYLLGAINAIKERARSSFPPPELHYSLILIYNDLSSESTGLQAEAQDAAPYDYCVFIYLLHKTNAANSICLFFFL